MPHVDNDRVIASTTEARAGVTGQNVRYVLVAGTIAVAVLFSALLIYFFGLSS